MQLTPENRQRLQDTVFGKTAAGRAEVERRAAGLTARERAVLILLDGRKALKDIGTWLPEDEMLAAVEALLRKGLAGIEARPAPGAPAAPAPAAQARAATPSAAPVAASAATPAAPPAAATAASSAAAPAAAPAAPSAAAPAAPPAAAAQAPDLPAAARAAQALMVAAARRHLGLLAADLVRRIEQARDASQLAGVVGLWHVSLRESKTGKPYAEGLLEEARALLA